jgi:hypothetical protein
MGKEEMIRWIVSIYYKVKNLFIKKQYDDDLQNIKKYQKSNLEFLINLIGEEK